MNKTEKKKFYSELFALALPLALQELLASLVGASDALMLGRLTQESISAVSLANQVSFVLSLFMFGIIGAVGILVAQYYGKGDRGTVKKLMCMSIRYVFIVSLVFFLLAFFIPDKLMMFFTDEQALIDIGSSYLRIVSFSYFFMALTQCYTMLMRVDGRAKMIVIISSVTVVVDMVADFFLIYGFGNIPALGANGSAYSTIVVEVMGFIWVVVASYKKDRIHPDISGILAFDKRLEKDMIKVAIPMLASCLSWGLSITAHSAIIGHMGVDATAAFSVTNVATSLIQCFSQGFSQGAGIMLGALLGKNMLDQAKKYGRLCWDVAIYIGFLNALMIGAVGPLVYKFYVLEPMAKQFLIYMILYNLLYMFAYSFNTMFTVGVFPAGGDAKYDAISVFFATWCFALPLSFIGCFFLKWPVMAVYMVMCADEIVKVPFIIPRYRKYIWLKNLTRTEISE